MKTLDFDWIGEFFVKKNIIEEEEKKLYIFDLRQRLMIPLDILTALALGYLLGGIWESVVFLLAYAPIRIYAGGFCATTLVGCYLIFVGLTVSALLIIKFVPWSPILCLIGLIFGSALVFLLAPAADKNMPFTSKEKIVFQRKIRDFLVIYILLAMLFIQLDYLLLPVSIMMSLNALVFMLVLGRIKNNIYRKRSA